MRAWVATLALIAACGGAPAAPQVASRQSALTQLSCDDPYSFGVVADARDAGGSFTLHPTDTTQALQAWLDACQGRTITLPAGAYYLHGGGGGALLDITYATDLRSDPAAVIYVSADASTDVLLVEYPGWAPTLWASLRPTGLNVHIRGFRFASGSFRNGIVIHSPAAYVHDTLVDDAAGWGILVESGAVGTNIVGATRLAQGAWINSNFCRLERLDLEDDGDQDYPGTQDHGGGLWVHGSDSNGISVSDSFASYVNIGFQDGSLGGVTWRRCYVETGGQAGNAVGFADWSSAGARYYDCQEEIAHPSPQTNVNSRVYGMRLFGMNPR